MRISGDSPLSIAEKMFVPSGKTAVKDFRPYRLYPGEIDGGTFTDYGLCVYFKAPASYTGEDVVEFHCHGGENIARGILKRTFRLGASAAGRGEFTKRAFLNGKLSLASAEGIADMINGESEAEVKAGYLLYSERLTGKVREIQDVLKEVLAGIDAAIDYPEEGIEEESTDDIRLALQRAKGEVSVLLSGYAKGKKIKSGVTVALCGKPNTGKSSLLNRLLGYEKAIVSDIAGTTRGRRGRRIGNRRSALQSLRYGGSARERRRDRKYRYRARGKYRPFRGSRSVRGGFGGGYGRRGRARFGTRRGKTAREGFQ